MSSPGSTARLTAEDIELRGTLLAKNPGLLRLHKELVMSGMVAEEEFWEGRQGMLKAQATLSQQKKAITSVLSANLKPITEGTGDVKYMLTPAIIRSILSQNPAGTNVDNAYRENVPSRLTEKEFWTQYFQSRFFQRERGSTSTATDASNILDKYFEEEVAASEKAVDSSVLQLPRSLDIVGSMDEDRLADEDDGRHGEQTRLSRGSVSLALLRKFNQHSLKVVRSIRPISIIHEDLRAATELADLQEDKREDVLPLGLQEQSYLETEQDSQERTEECGAEMAETIVDTLKNWRPGPFEAYMQSYAEYSSAMAEFKVLDSIRHDVSQESTALATEETRAFHSNAMEILRHFWSASPINTPDREAKATRMLAILQQLRRKFEDRLKDMSAEQGQHLSRLMQTTQRCIDKAQSMFEETAKIPAHKRARIS